MEFRILGPLEVVTGGEAVAVGGAKQRALLIALLLEANRVAPTPALIDAIWPDEPPADAVAALQVRVSQLRKALGPSLALATVGLGYRLRLEAGELDSLLFEQLAGAGRDELAAGRHDPAAAVLGEALALWRGAALADVADEPFARAAAARFEELRRGAIEDRLDAALALGRHGQAIAELEAIVHSEPLRERPRALLMLALYRSGRQAEALDTYHQARRLLDDELGVTPSPVLRRLVEAILQQDPSLDLVVAAPRPREPSPQPSQRKLATVVAFEPAGAGTGDPERLELEHGRFVEILAGESQRADGRLEVTGDGSANIVFGAPVSHENHTERALRAALALRDVLTPSAGGFGVESGEVLVSDWPGESPRISGLPLQLARRLAIGARPGEIRVGERAAATARRRFEFAPHSPGATARTLVAPFVVGQHRSAGAFLGRAAESKRLQDIFEGVRRGDAPRFALVVGDAGVGKSRLLSTFSEWLAGRACACRLCRCRPTGEGAAFAPLADVLRDELALDDDDAPETISERLGARGILALALGAQPPAGLHPLVVRERHRAAWVDLLEQRASHEPVVLGVEDLHWAAPVLLELLDEIVETVHGRLLVVSTARPEILDGGGPPVLSRPRAETLRVEPLDDASCTLLVDHLVGSPAAPHLRTTLAAQSEGNPFHLEELVSAAIDRGDIVTGPDGRDLRPGAALDVPDSVRDVVAARIDLLPPDDRDALRAAAVIGRIFWREPLRELVGLHPDLALLESREFVQRRSPSSLQGEHEYQFRHAVIREVAYGGLAVTARARGHAAFADWLLRTGAGRDEQAALLAHHYAVAADPGQADIAWPREPDELARLRAAAHHWLSRTGELAIARYELATGIGLMHRALEFAASDDERSRLWHAIGHAHGLAFDGEPFWTAMDRALELAVEDCARAAIAGEVALQSFVRAGMWVSRPAMERVESWIALALALAAPGSADRARALAASAFLDLDDGPAAEAAVSIAERLDDAELCVHAWEARAAVAMAAGDHETAWQFRSRRLGLLPRIGDPDLRTIVAETAFAACIATGRLAKAREVAILHDGLTRGLTPHHRLHGVAIRLEVDELVGDWQAIRETEREAREAVAENARTPCIRNARSLLVCALAREAGGDLIGSQQLEREADELGPDGHPVLDGPRLQLALLRGDEHTAAAAVERLVADRSWYTRGHSTSLATLLAIIDGLAAIGDGDRLDHAIAQLRRPGPFVAPFLLRARGLAHHDPQLVQRAVEEFDRLGLSWHAERSRRLP